MTDTLIQNGRIIDPASGRDEIGDVLIKDGRIAEVGKVHGGADRRIDARGLLVTPGLIDMHVHLREPGDEEEETIASGAAAARQLAVFEHGGNSYLFVSDGVDGVDANDVMFKMTGITGLSDTTLSGGNLTIK